VKCTDELFLRILVIPLVLPIRQVGSGLWSWSIVGSGKAAEGVSDRYAANP
jgi:hypothetical protein